MSKDKALREWVVEFAEDNIQSYTIDDDHIYKKLNEFVKAYDELVKAHDEMVTVTKAMQEVFKQVEPEMSALKAKLAECVAFIEDLESSPELSRTLVGVSVQQVAREVLAKVKK